MKVLQVSIVGLAKGGVQTVIMNICKNNPATHFDVLLFTDKKRYYDDEFLKLGGKIYRIPHYEGNSIIRKKLDYIIRIFPIFFYVYRLLKKEKYDAIHCHNKFESGICNLAAYLAGIEIRIAHAHTSNGLFTEKSFKNIVAYPYRKIMQILLNKFNYGFRHGLLLSNNNSCNISNMCELLYNTC